MIKTSCRQYSIEESVVAFYAVELINMVYRLHQCHVIHGDINQMLYMYIYIMIMDIRLVQYHKRVLSFCVDNRTLIRCTYILLAAATAVIIIM